MSTQNVEEFLECLTAEGSVFQGTLRVSILKNPVDGKRHSATKYEVVLQAGAVIILDDDSQYLLEMGIECGADYHDASQEFKGTEKAKEIKAELAAFAEANGLHILPGVIGI